jgi:acyl dehydratase
MTRQRIVTGRYYEDFEIGEELSSIGKTVGEGQFDIFSGLTGDFSDVHNDEEVMSETEFGGRIGHALFGLSLMQGLMWLTMYNVGTAFATVGWDKIKFPTPLRAGDTVRARWTIAAKRESRSRPQYGLLTEDCALINQRGEKVVTGEHILMIRRRADEPTNE